MADDAHKPPSKLGIMVSLSKKTGLIRIGICGAAAEMMPSRCSCADPSCGVLALTIFQGTPSDLRETASGLLRAAEHAEEALEPISAAAPSASAMH